MSLANTPPKDTYVMYEFVPVAFPEFFSVQEVDASRERLQRVVGVTKVELERLRRQRDSHPTASVTSGTDNEIE